MVSGAAGHGLSTKAHALESNPFPYDDEVPATTSQSSPEKTTSPDHGGDLAQRAMTNPDHTPEATPDIHLEFFSRPIYLGAIRRMLDSLCEKMGLDPHQSSRICLAVDEAICNVIRHGYDNSPDGRITLQLTRIDEGAPNLLIEVLDRGKHADLDTIRSRNLDDVRPGGLGVHIINEIMETVEYSHREDGGMKLTMRYPLGSNRKKTIGSEPSNE